jgi:hypothetical protein
LNALCPALRCNLINCVWGGVVVSDFDPVEFLKSDNPVLRRLAEELLEEDGETGPVKAAHSSHSSGTGKGHSSYVSSTMRETMTVDGSDE